MISPVFIVGTPRSGTTLLAKILGRHDRLFMPGETHFMDDIYSRRHRDSVVSPDELEAALDRLKSIYQRYSEPDDHERLQSIWTPAFESRLRAEGSSYRTLFERFMTMQASSLRKERWGNNAPRDIFNVLDLLHLFPGSKIVACIRDPRAFLLSYSRKWRNSLDPARVEKLYHPVITSLLWKSTARQIVRLSKTLPESTFLVVRYEDLVTQPEKTVKRICRFIGEKYNPAMLDIDFHNSSLDNNRKGIYANSIDSWRQELDLLDASIPSLIAREEMVSFEYSPEVTSNSLGRLAWTFASLPFAALRAIHANRINRGPLVPYLLRRLQLLWTKG